MCTAVHWARPNWSCLSLPDTACIREVVIEDQLLDWLGQHRRYAVLLVPVIAFAEACVGLGLFVSGIFLVIVSSWIYLEGIADLYLILPLAFIGALSSDHFGFYLGRWVGPRLHMTAFATRHHNAITRADTMVRRLHGPRRDHHRRRYFNPLVRAASPVTAPLETPS